MDTHTEEKEFQAEVSVSLGVLWKILCKHWILLLAISLIVAIGVGVLYYAVYTPVYSSSSQFYVCNVADTTSLYSNGQTSGAKEMAGNIANFVNGTVVLDAVLDAAGLKNELTVERLRGMIKTQVDADSAVISVRVSGQDAARNYLIAQAIEQVLPTYSDYFNNQMVNTPVIGTDSKMLKVYDRSQEDRIADNRSNLYKYPILAFLLVFVLMYIAFLIARVTDQTIYSKNDIKEKLNDASVFGVIPHWAIGSASQSAKKARKSRKNRFARSNVDDRLINRERVPFEVNEAFQQLCTNVTFCSSGQKGCTVGVLSSLANSGKSFVMANLAISLSKMIDKRVLLVDADMRCPMLHRIFRLENKQGLSNLLAGQVENEQNVLHTVGDTDALTVLTSGTLPPNPMELLSGPMMQAQINRWKEQYDYILIDLPPVGEVSDAVAISALVSGYLFVLRSGLSDARLVREAAQLITEKAAKIYGYVLTDVEGEHLGYQYAYGRYSKYSKYSKYAKYAAAGAYRNAGADTEN